MPHVHFHILPRKLKADFFTRNDDVYPALDRAEHALPAAHAQPLQVDADEDRKPRTAEDMEREARWLRAFFEQAQEGGTEGT